MILFNLRVWDHFNRKKVILATVELPKWWLYSFKPGNIKYLSFIYCFTSCSRILPFYGDVTINGESLQNLGLCLAVKAFEKAGSLSCHTCCDTGHRIPLSYPENPSFWSPLTIEKGYGRPSAIRWLKCIIYNNHISTVTSNYLPDVNQANVCM